MYRIISTEVKEETLNTVVEFTFLDDSKKIITVSHFMPMNKEIVITGIENREISEQRKLDAIVTNEAIKIDLDNDII